MSNVPVSKPSSEVSALSTDLRSIEAERDPAYRRNVLRRVIALMNVNVDTSSLFPSMVVACATSDVVSKKLIYFYLTTYARQKADLALLSINTLVKECADESALIRGLALRTLAELRVARLYDYLVPALQRGVLDPAAYVRKTAVMGMLKVYLHTRTTFAQHDFFDQITRTLHEDSDTGVCINALHVLMEISAREGGARETGGARHKARDRLAIGPFHFVITKPLLYALLKRLPTLDDRQKAFVIGLISPRTGLVLEEDYILDLMNVLDDYLDHARTDVLLASAAALVYLTQNYPAARDRVLHRLRRPLLSALIRCESEEARYVLLCHIRLCVIRAPALYARSAHYFYCRSDDPLHVQQVKMDTLWRIAGPTHAEHILRELAAYVEERQPGSAGVALHAMTALAHDLPHMRAAVADYLITCMTQGPAYLRRASFTAAVNVLRDYRDTAESIWRPLVLTMVRVHTILPCGDDGSRVALLWVLGELAAAIPSGPAVFAELCENVTSESAPFRRQALTSALKLYFVYPAAMESVLTSLWRCMMDDFSDADVHDRALFYYRLMRADPVRAERIINSVMEPPHNGGTGAPRRFAEDDNEDVDGVDSLFEELNTLSVVYGMPMGSAALLPSSVSDDDCEDDEDTSRDEEEDENREEDGENAGPAANNSCRNSVNLAEDEALGPNRHSAHDALFIAQPGEGENVLFCTDSTNRTTRPRDSALAATSCMDEVFSSPSSHALPRTYSSGDSQQGVASTRVGATATLRLVKVAAVEDEDGREGAEDVSRGMTTDLYQSAWRSSRVIRVFHRQLDGRCAALHSRARTNATMVPTDDSPADSVRQRVYDPATASAEVAEWLIAGLAPHGIYTLASGPSADGGSRIYVYAHGSLSAPQPQPVSPLDALDATATAEQQQSQSSSEPEESRAGAARAREVQLFLAELRVSCDGALKATVRAAGELVDLFAQQLDANVAELCLSA